MGLLGDCEPHWMVVPNGVGNFTVLNGQGVLIGVLDLGRQRIWVTDERADDDIGPGP